MKGDQAVHRAGPAKQDNKKHKTGRHRSKGILDILKKGNFIYLVIFIHIFSYI